MTHSTQTHKLRVGILFGGKSAEHEVSIQSAQNVLEALDETKFEAVPISINQQGVWQQQPAQLNHLQSHLVDVVFPVLHGPFGEDGTVQGFLELANLPYVGPGVLGSAVGMDKDVMKRLLRASEIAVAESVTIHQHERPDLNLDATIERLGLPVFVKPANMGSSVGVSKATNKAEVAQALDEALRYDRKALIETAIVGDEVECAVLGNEYPEVSLPGRIITQADFYSYLEKYQDTGRTDIEIPAKLPSAISDKVRQTALQAFRALEGEGMARVDMFVTKSGQVLVNEINTIPGFTKRSAYPMLWEASGINYTELVTKLIELAVERFQRRQAITTTFRP